MVELPPPPNFAYPLKVKEPQVGEYLVVIAARERAGRLQANAQLDAFREWYKSLRRAAGGADGNGN